ncbi:phenylalanyl-tRNA synthetase, alpha subunit [Faunimonas pinastri]|uniref:Phenylalanine--tRNA ligase alpha subunit n=1 Tax=Faunimonas pinastri TaxID=1855383 RepID=A0A1H9GZ82_9HYPH|nr:phenylalanine--tRNA ligase subunit alpha [Faunimonas pinastri]SEQ55380.1 phenylalanyl-tRNA synthetase, alpha subunit [Faunimonas pinastri]
MTDLEELEQEILGAVAAAEDERGLEAVRLGALGKKGWISERMKSLGTMSPEERKEAGPALNGLKDRVTRALEAQRGILREAALEERLRTERVDVTLPARPESFGTIHPVTQVMEEVIAIFGDMGFSVAEGPHIETDWYNFGALNIPPEHPARQEHDTFYLREKEDGSRMVLRTHTSPVQIRTMEGTKPPIRIIAPGRTFRSDSDQTHTPMFHQVEGLVIDETASLANLKGTLEAFCKAFFEVDEVKMRFRPSYFPFTEPSMEVDIGCSWEGGELKIGVGDSWLEILGSGMVHPNVIRAGGLDPDKVQGFAFGMGIDRIAMLKYGIPDLRAFFEADLRWLRHYGFSSVAMPSLAEGLTT